MTDTPILGIPIPVGSDLAEVPPDLEAAFDVVDASPGVSRLTQAEIDALTAEQKPAGRYVHNLTRGRLQVSNGSTFYDTVGEYYDWTPVGILAPGSYLTGWTFVGRYRKSGLNVCGWGRGTMVTGSNVGSGSWKIPLPVAPAASSYSPLVGRGFCLTAAASPRFATFQLQKTAAAYTCDAVITGLAWADIQEDVLGTGTQDEARYGWGPLQVVSSSMWTQAAGGVPVGSVITWQFDYEADS